MGSAHRTERLWEPWRKPFVAEPVRGPRGPYQVDLSADEIDRLFAVELAIVKRARPFKIEDEPTRRTGGTYGVMLKPGRRRG
jgi:hypothetical protein